MSLGISAINTNMGFDPSEMFKKLDKNSDGGVTKEEFLAGIKKQDGDSDEKLAKMFEETDTDGDGIITEAENEAMMKKMQSQRPPQGAPQAAKSDSTSNTSNVSTNSKSYDVMDTNKDGKVSAKEKLAYAMKLLEETLTTDTTENEYTQTGSTTASSSSISSTFSVAA